LEKEKSKEILEKKEILWRVFKAFSFRGASIFLGPKILVENIEDIDETIDSLIYAFDNTDMSKIEIISTLGIFANAKRMNLIQEDIMPRIKKVLSKALQSEDYHIRFSAIQDLSNLEKDASEFTPLIMDVINNKDEKDELRAYAVQTFRDINPNTNEVFDVLSNIIKFDKSLKVRERAANALGRYKSKRSEQLLVDLMKYDKDIEIRRSAVFSLGFMGAKEAVNTIIENIDLPKNKEIRFEFVRALIRIEGKEGKGYQIYEELCERNELTTEQIYIIEYDLEDIKLAEKVTEFKKEIIEVGNESLYNKFEELEKTIHDIREDSQKALNKTDQFSKLFGKKEGELILDYGSLSKEIVMNTERIKLETEPLKERIGDIQKNMRIYLIVISIIFSALTGTFIGVLIHLINIVSQLNS